MVIGDTNGQADRVRAWTLDDFVAEAAKQLQGEGWAIARSQSGADAAWHVAASKGARWLVVQVLVPATVFASRRADKVRLGQAAHLTGKEGKMEQWLAHVRPGGRVIFGHDALSNSAWATTVSGQQVRERLGLDAEDGRRTPPAGTSG